MTGKDRQRVFGKAFNVIATLALALMLAGGAFVAYLFGTGKLNTERMETMAAVLRGELDAPQAQTSEAAPEPALEPQPEREPTASTAEEVEAMRRREHLVMLQTERAARDLEARRALLDQTMQNLLQEREQFAAQQQEWQQRRQAQEELDRDQGFQKELELVESLQPRQAKAHLIETWQKEPADAVRLVNAMDPSRVKRVLGYFKTPEELQIMTDLLEQIRIHGTQGYAD